MSGTDGDVAGSSSSLVVTDSVMRTGAHATPKNDFVVHHSVLKNEVLPSVTAAVAAAICGGQNENAEALGTWYASTEKSVTVTIPVRHKDWCICKINLRRIMS